MNRVIYCPSELFIQEASCLAKNNHLQIIIGDNYHTKELDFDRTQISVVSIPEHKGYFVKNVVEQNFHQCIMYKNDFNVIKDKIQLYIDNEKINPQYCESHVAKFIYLCRKTGEYCCKIIIDGNIEEEFSFVVN